MIVIEGCDGTGKTTLAKYLAKELNFKYWHGSSGPVNTLFEAASRHAPVLQIGKVVFDRTFIISEWVYSEFTKRKEPLINCKLLLRELILERQPLFIFCNSMPDVIRKNITTTSEADSKFTKEIVLPNLEKIQDKYYEMYLYIQEFYKEVLNKTNAITFDYELETKELILHICKDHFK